MERQQRKENPNSSYVNMLFLLTTRYLDIEESNTSSIEVCVCLAYGTETHLDLRRLRVSFVGFKGETTPLFNIITHLLDARSWP